MYINIILYYPNLINSHELNTNLVEIATTLIGAIITAQIVEFVAALTDNIIGHLVNAILCF